MQNLYFLHLLMNLGNEPGDLYPQRLIRNRVVYFIVAVCGGENFQTELICCSVTLILDNDS